MLTADAQGKPLKTVTGSVGDAAAIQQTIRKEDWNSYRIVADGHRLQHFINGTATAECLDKHREIRRRIGILALQLHTGPAMKVQFRNFRLKRLPATKRVAFIAGRKSHGYGAHEHRAGCMLLAEALSESGLPLETVVTTDGWPSDANFLKDVDAIVIYADGGARHPFNEHLGELHQLMAQGIGVVCLHYGVEVPAGQSGDAFLDWTGGYFETDWSVNPHWTAAYNTFPHHPIANGVRPFAIRDSRRMVLPHEVPRGDARCDTDTHGPATC